MDTSKRIEYTNLLLAMVPENGSNIGNVTLRDQLQKSVAGSGDQISEDDYWALRDALIDQGKIEQGRGRGGSVHLVGTKVAPDSLAEGQSTLPVVPEAEVPQKQSESSLYGPFHAAIRTGYVKENRIKRFVSEVTAQQGRRATGGKWTRPDLMLIAVRTYKFSPGKRLEVISFEVKPNIESAFEGVYEALAHSAFAHRSYLAVDVSGCKGTDVPDDRIIQECTRHGVGYIKFDNVNDYDTYDTVCSARLNEPDPYDVDNFIRTQISLPNQDDLSEFLQ